MSEQKVWVEKMPEYCDECPCSQRGKDDYAYCNLLHKNIGYDFGKIPKHCQLIDIKDHDREKNKRIKELEQKVQELQEVSKKMAFGLYSALYNELERQDPENVASRIEYMTSENYADICEMYKTAKNLKQHDRELVKEVCEKIIRLAKLQNNDNFYIMTGCIIDEIRKEYEK